MDKARMAAAEAKAARAFKRDPNQSDADAFARILDQLDESELRGFMLACEIYMMQRLANAQSKPDPIAP